MDSRLPPDRGFKFTDATTMHFLSHFRREFRKRRNEDASDEQCRAGEWLNSWLDKNPSATEDEAVAVLHEKYGSLLVTLLIVQAVVMIVYYLRSMPRGEEDEGSDE